MASDKEMEAFNRWVGYLPRLDAIPDRELVVLKVHVIAEDALHHLLALRLDVEEGPLRERRSRFADLLAVALPKPSDKPLRDALRHLNDARNSAAHRNEDPEFDNQVKLFVDSARRLEDGKRDIASQDPLEMVKQAGVHAIYAVYIKASELWKL